MNTRSQTKINNNNKALYEVNIDFDEASAAWRANKKQVVDGTFKYICCGLTKTGNKCNRQPLQNTEYCKIHTKL
jgi:hypothetical protein